MKQIKRVQFDPPGNIEIFYVEDGQYQWQKFVSGVDYTDFLAMLQTELNNGVQPAPTANWSGFMIGMFADTGYQQIRALTTNQIQAQQLELSVATITSGGIPFDAQLFFPLWNAVIAGLDVVPSLESIQGWIAIAQSSNMPFTFSESGLVSNPRLKADGLQPSSK